MPSAPSYPGDRPITPSPRAKPSFEMYRSYEAGRITLGAVTTFQEVIHFSGKPDSIILTTASPNVEVRLRNDGEAPRSPILLQGNFGTDLYLKGTAEIVEARDPAGLGGQVVQAIGRWASADEEPRRDHAFVRGGNYGGFTDGRPHRGQID